MLSLSLDRSILRDIASTYSRSDREFSKGRVKTLDVTKTSVTSDGASERNADLSSS